VNKNYVGVIIGAGLLLSGCGTATTQAAHPAPTWQTINLEQASVVAQVRVPVAWTKNFGLTGAGDSVAMGPHNWSHGDPELGLCYGGAAHWYPPKPLFTQVFHDQYSAYKRLHPIHAYFWVDVPNTPTYRKLAQTIIRSVKQIPLTPHKKG
jgi:hypothetical protein